MLLSRVAEAVYWAGRYLERAESTARIIRVHTDLYLDLPRSAGLTWAPLLAITGSDEEFSECYEQPSEEAVTSWLSFDARNPGSIVASLHQARDNVRVARAAFPREAWELLNDLYLRTAETCESAVLRGTRVSWLERIVADSQRMNGMLAATMTHDSTYLFLRLGRHLERSDLTTRVLDVRAGYLMANGNRLGPFTEVTWMGVLKSLAAYQMYRRTSQTRVQGPDVLRFLLQDHAFPRSLQYCLTQATATLRDLPDHDAPLARCAEVQRVIEQAKVRTLAWDGLHDYADGLQVLLAALHDDLERSYFRRTDVAADTDPSARLATA